jgi:hypothetical protein
LCTFSSSTPFALSGHVDYVEIVLGVSLIQIFI